MILVTGASGAVGSYFCAHLREHFPARKIVGLVRSALRWDVPGVHYVRGDLCAPDTLTRFLEAAKRTHPAAFEAPDQLHVAHFASNADVSGAFHDPRGVFTNNVPSTLNLYDALRPLVGLRPRILLASTPEVYGVTHAPVDETAPIAPHNPYAASKAAQEAIASAYQHSYGLLTVTARAFTYINPRRQTLFSTSIARQIVAAERGLGPAEIRHGGLESIRAITDVRDIVRAYAALLLSAVPGEAYNIGATQPAALLTVAESLVARARTPVRLVYDATRARPVDVPLQAPRIEKLREAIGWKPRYTLNEALDWLMDETRRAFDGAAGAD